MVFTFIQLLVTAGLGTLINFLLGITLPTWVDSLEPLLNEDKEYSPDECSSCQRTLRPFRRSRTTYSDLDSTTKLPLFDNSELSFQSPLLRFRGRLNSVCNAHLGGNPSSIYVFLAFVLAFRLALGNILLRYVSIHESEAASLANLLF